MKIRTLMTSALMLAAMSAPSFAFDNGKSGTDMLSTLSNSHRLLQTISCNPNDDDKQARCARDCEDIFIKASQAYNANVEAARAERKVCDAKCGC